MFSAPGTYPVAPRYQAHRYHVYVYYFEGEPARWVCETKRPVPRDKARKLILEYSEAGLSAKRVPA